MFEKSSVPRNSTRVFCFIKKKNEVIRSFFSNCVFWIYRSQKNDRNFRIQSTYDVKFDFYESRKKFGENKSVPSIREDWGN